MQKYASFETLVVVSGSGISRMWWVNHQIENPAQLAVEPMIEGAAAGVTEGKESHPNNF